MTTVQPHAIWAWSSKLVSLKCRCRRTADEVSAYGRTFGTDGGTGLGRILSSDARPGGHVTSLGDLAKRPCHSPDLPVLQLVGTIPAATGGQ